MKMVCHNGFPAPEIPIYAPGNYNTHRISGYITGSLIHKLN